MRASNWSAGPRLVGRPEIMSILKDVYAGGRLSVMWGPLDGQMRGTLRMAFLALLCLETAMPYGGRIEVAQDGDGLILNGHADKFILDEALWSRLSGHVLLEELRPAHVQFGLLPAVAADEGRTVSTCMTESCVTINI